MTADQPAILLRALEPSDVDCIYLWENTPGMWRHGFAPAPLSRHMIWEYVQNYEADPLLAGQLRLMVEVDGEAAGAVDLYDVDRLNRRAMVGIMVAPRWRGQGVAKAALGHLGRYCSDVLGLNQLAAVAEEGNEASRRLFLSAGYSECGFMRQWFRRGRDYAAGVLFQLILS